MKKRILDGLKPDQIRRLLWWADEEERRKFKEYLPDGEYIPRFTITALAKHKGVTEDEISRVIMGYKSLRVEKIVSDAIRPYLWAKNSRELKDKYQQRKTSKSPKEKKERKNASLESKGTLAADECLYEFLNFMKIERNYSNNTITTYQGNLIRYLAFLNARSKSIEDVKRSDVVELLASLASLGSAPASRGQQLTAIRMFHRFLINEEYLSNNPAEGISSPKIPKKLPDILEVEEIEQIIAQTDLSTPKGIRDRAMIEFLYATGARVGELVKIAIRSLYLKKGFAIVFGKGSKERIVCIHEKAIDCINLYLNESRPLIATSKSSDVLFLNHRGKPLTRQ